MKYLILLAALATSAHGLDLEYKASTIDHTVGTGGKFSLNLFQLGMAETFGPLGVRLMAGTTNTSSNKVQSTWTETQLREFWVLNTHIKQAVTDKVTMNLGLNYTMYKSVTSENIGGKDIGTSAELEYKLSNEYAVRFSVDKYLKQPLLNGSQESTTGLGLALAVRL